MLALAAVNGRSQWVEMTDLKDVSFTLRLQTSGAAYAGTLTIRGTNNDAQDAAEPVLATPTIITAPPTGLTYAAGVITLAAVPIGVSSVTIKIPDRPKWILFDNIYTSGGGTVVLAGFLAGWS